MSVCHSFQPVMHHHGPSFESRSSSLQQQIDNVEDGSSRGQPALDPEECYEKLQSGCHTHLAEDRSTVLAALTYHSDIFPYASEALRSDPTIVNEACRRNAENWQYASESIRDDKTFCMEFMQKRFYHGAVTSLLPLTCLSERLQDDEDVVLCGLQKNMSHNCFTASERLLEDKSFLMKASQMEGMILEAASEKLQDDKEVVMVACCQNGMALRFASTRLRNNKEVASVACQQNGYALKYASVQLRDTLTVVLSACRQSGGALRLTGKNSRDNEDVVKAACQQSYLALHHASERLKRDTKFIAEICMLVKADPDVDSRMLILMADSTITDKIVRFDTFLMDESHHLFHLDTENPAALVDHIRDQHAFRSVCRHLTLNGISMPIETRSTTATSSTPASFSRTTNTSVTVPESVMSIVAEYVGVPMESDTPALSLLEEISPLATAYAELVEDGTWDSIFEEEFDQYASDNDLVLERDIKKVQSGNDADQHSTWHRDRRGNNLIIETIQNCSTSRAA